MLNVLKQEREMISSNQRVEVSQLSNIFLSSSYFVDIWSLMDV
jgi:hypothetical protein